jgi:beta-galactosidase
VKDKANAVVDQPLPGLLSEVCGVKVAEYDSLLEGITQSVRFIVPELKALDPVPARIWCDVLDPAGAQVLGSYTEDYYAGRAAVTLNRFGKGLAMYIGTFGDASLYQALFGWLMQSLNMTSNLITPPGVEVTERWRGDQRLLFVLNHNSVSQTINLLEGCINLFDDQARAGSTTIAPHDVIILAARK